MNMRSLSIAAILIVVVLFFSSSLVDRRERSFTSSQQENDEHHRSLKSLKRIQRQQRHYRQQFVLNSGTHPTANVYQPYFVTMDGVTGEHLYTIPDGHAHNPLSWLMDSRELRNDAEQQESIFYFIVPKSNGGKMKSILTRCFNLRRTEKVQDPESLEYIGGVLNIDTQTRAGLAAARANDVLGTGLVDVIATSYFLEGIMLYNQQHRGRAFTILNHPVHRVENLYLSRKDNDESAGLSIMEYLLSTRHIDNWVVRSLTNDKLGKLTEKHLAIAKGILARKFLIGIAEYVEDTIKRLEMYYQLDNLSEECVQRYIKKLEGTNSTSTIVRGSEEWNLIAGRESYDMMLYYYALELFAKQASTIFKRPYVDRNGKLIDFAARRKKEKEMFRKNLLEQLVQFVDEPAATDDALNVWIDDSIERNDKL
jgi:hypothetical protein